MLPLYELPAEERDTVPYEEEPADCDVAGLRKTVVLAVLPDVCAVALAVELPLYPLVEPRYAVPEEELL